MSEQSQEDLRYHKNFLTNVIFRLDFPSRAKEIDDSVDIFRQDLKSLFPIHEKKQLREYIATFEKDKKIDQENVYLNHYFFDTNKEKNVSLSHNFIILEFFKYKDFDDFLSCAQFVVDCLLKLHEGIDFTRVGLRYINQIIFEKGNPFIWKDYIDSSLTHVIDKFLDKNPNISRSMSQIILNLDDYKLNFNYGMFNSDFPAKISRKEFVLDYDCFSEFIEKERILSCLKDFNSEIKTLFEKSIKDGLRKIMGVIG